MRCCPFTGCNRPIASHLFACARHWYRLDPAVRAHVYELYRRWQAGEITAESLRAEQDLIVRAHELCEEPPHA